MNRTKRPMPAQLRKKMNKEIRSAVPAKPVRPTSDDIKADDLLSRYRGKTKKKGSSALNSLIHNIADKKKKRAAKHSKRTTPGLVDLQSPPAEAHVEGKRWIKTIQKQNAANNKTFVKKMAKRGRLK